MGNMKMDFLDASWLDHDEFILYGFGEKLGMPVIDSLLKDVRIVKIIDNDPAKQGEYKGIPIVGAEAIARDPRRCKIIVALSDVWFPAVSAQLTDLGLKENVDFCRVRPFFLDYYYGKFHRSVMYPVQSMLTTRCTLNCKNCSLFMPYYEDKDQYTYDITEMKKDYDLLFSFTDYIPLICLVGGETFLYKELGTIIAYLSEHYSGRYGGIVIPSNGTVVPNETLLSIMRDAKVSVQVSDYTPVVNYKETLNKVCGLYEKYGILYSLHTFPAAWSDLGIPHSAPLKFPSVREHMLLCNPEYKTYNNGKLYYCNTSLSAEKVGLFSLAPDDYIDLRELPVCEESKRKIVRYSMGIFENKDYMSMCAVCNGCGAHNPLRVQPGVQMPRK